MESTNKMEVICIGTGILSMINAELLKSLEKMIGVNAKIGHFQKPAVLGTARIYPGVFESTGGRQLVVCYSLQ